MKIGDLAEFKKKVSSDEFASFNGEVVHPVYATYHLARDFEWTTRQFVLNNKASDEEGIGTFVSVEHMGAAVEGDEIIFKGYISEIQGNTLICEVYAYVGGKLIAKGRTGQKILKKEKLKSLFKQK